MKMFPQVLSEDEFSEAPACDQIKNGRQLQMEL
jgi:hypothetical protein